MYYIFGGFSPLRSLRVLHFFATSPFTLSNASTEQCLNFFRAVFACFSRPTFVLSVSLMILWHVWAFAPSISGLTSKFLTLLNLFVKATSIIDLYFPNISYVGFPISYILLSKLIPVYCRKPMNNALFLLFLMFPFMS